MNILITYDFLTTDKDIGKNLCTKIGFIKKILSYLRQNITLDDTSYREFPMQELFTSLNLEYADNIFQIIDFSSLSKNDLSLIISYIKDYDLLITYELSTETKYLFDQHHITYIDMWMSPIRFCKDIMFSFYSNNQEIQKKLKKYSISNEMILSEVDTFKNHIRYFHEDDIFLEDNSALIIGQLFKDKAVIEGNKFLTLMDYVDEIQTLALKYNKLYLLKHPYLQEKEFQIVLEAFAHIKNIEYINNVNIYSLLLKEEIKMVIGISSSVLFEAQYFQKKIHYLYKPVLDNSYIHIYKSYFKVDFWSDILDIENSKKNIEHLNYDNNLRYLFGAFYAYDSFMLDKKNYSQSISQKVSKEVSKEVSYTSPVQLYNSLSTLDKSKKYILYGYGSIAKLILPHIKENVVGVIDKNLSLTNIKTIDDLDVLSVETLSNKDNIIITAFKYYAEIEKELQQYDCNIISYLEKYGDS